MNKNIATLLISLTMALGLAGCGAGDDGLPTITAESRDVEFTVPARGELIASESLPVALPPGIRMGFNIAWMAPEFSEVRKGDVVARFDDTEIVQTRQSTSLNLAKSDFKLAEMARTGTLEQIRIDHETGRVDGERNITEAFASVDPRLMSRNEIIDALSDVDYLNVEAAYLEWQWQTFDQRAQAEQDTILAEKKGELAVLEKQDKALGMMELRSPADGTFIYATTPWGAKLGKGKRVFPGMPLGLLPVRGKVRARLFVAEGDAVGLAEGQAVRLRLDTATDQEFNATVVSVSTVASPLKREEPQKFFTVEADFETIDAELMRVGARLRAQIITGTLDDGIVVPAQAVYGDGDDAWLFVAEGGKPVKRAVSLGRRGPDMVQVSAGIEAGERIVLVAPENAG